MYGDGTCEKSESAHGRGPEWKGVYGEAGSSTTWPSSRVYHDISSSSVRSPSGSASVNSSAVAELALSGDSRALADDERVNMSALHCGGFEQLRGAGDKVEAWSFVVVVGRQWDCGKVVSGAGGHAGEGVGERVRRQGGDFDR